jgi:hypothetical protein
MYRLIIHHERDDSEHADTRIGRSAYVRDLKATSADEARAEAAAYLRATPEVLSGAPVGSVALAIDVVSVLDPKAILADYQAEVAGSADAAAKAEAEVAVRAAVERWPDLAVAVLDAGGSVTP